MVDQPTPKSRPQVVNGSSAEGALTRFVLQHQRIFRTVILFVVVAAIVGGTIAWIGGWLDVQKAGYWGAFVVNLVGSATVVIPLPGLIAVSAAAAPELGLNFVLLGFVGAAGSTIGELTGYLAGYGSQGVVRKSRYYARISDWISRRGGFALFVLAIVPTPLFDIGGFAAGSLGYPISRFLFWVGFGKLLKFLVFAYAGQQGISWLLDLIRPW